jgi:hypothetical protein
VQLFGGDFTFVGNDEPSMRFDNFYQAFLALFQVKETIKEALDKREVNKMLDHDR